jgi:hypothetical protein
MSGLPEQTDIGMTARVEQHYRTLLPADWRAEWLTCAGLARDSTVREPRRLANRT